jgi:hypothetical protein
VKPPKDDGPQLKDYRTFEEWSFWRRRWSTSRAKLDRLFPFRYKGLSVWGESNPIPLLKEEDKPL